MCPSAVQAHGKLVVRSGGAPHTSWQITIGNQSLFLSSISLLFLLEAPCGSLWLSSLLIAGKQKHRTATTELTAQQEHSRKEP